MRTPKEWIRKEIPSWKKGEYEMGAQSRICVFESAQKGEKGGPSVNAKER